MESRIADFVYRIVDFGYRIVEFGYGIGMCFMNYSKLYIFLFVSARQNFVKKEKKFNLVIVYLKLFVSRIQI